MYRTYMSNILKVYSSRSLQSGTSLNSVLLVVWSMLFSKKISSLCMNYYGCLDLRVMLPVWSIKNLASSKLVSSGTSSSTPCKVHAISNSDFFKISLTADVVLIYNAYTFSSKSASAVALCTLFSIAWCMNVWILAISVLLYRKQVWLTSKSTL